MCCSPTACKYIQILVVMLYLWLLIYSIKIICPREESPTIILINEYSINLTPNGFLLYSLISTSFHPHLKNRPWLTKGAKLSKMQKIRYYRMLNPKYNNINFCEITGLAWFLQDETTYLLSETLTPMSLLPSRCNLTFRVPDSTEVRSGSVSMFSVQLRKEELKHP